MDGFGSAFLPQREVNPTGSRSSDCPALNEDFDHPWVSDGFLSVRSEVPAGPPWCQTLHRSLPAAGSPRLAVRGSQDRHRRMGRMKEEWRNPARDAFG